MEQEPQSSILFLRINYNIDDRLTIQFNPTIGTEEKKLEVSTTTKQFFDVLQEDITVIYRIHQEIRAKFKKGNKKSNEFEIDITKSLKETTVLKKVETSGKKIYQNILPLQIKGYLKEYSISTIVIRSEEYLIPFELMHDGKSFLSKQYNFYRDPILEKEPLKISPYAKNHPPQIVFFTNPTKDLPGAEEETKEIISFLELKKLQVSNFREEKASWKTLSNVFDLPRLDILHYSGHSKIENDNIHFFLHDAPFSATDIFLQYPALFFLNMCESDVCVEQKVDFKGYITLNFPLAVMKRGAKACIATLWPIVDQTAAKFAIAFYEQILKENNFGEAIRVAKLKTSKLSPPNDITWLSFILYGSPISDTITFPKRKISESITSALPHSITVFLGYSTKDYERFSIQGITNKLAKYKDFKVLIWDEFKELRDSGSGNGLKGIQKHLYVPPLGKLKMMSESDVYLLFCSKNTKKSISVKSDWLGALKSRKPIIPITRKPENIPDQLKFSGIEPVEFGKTDINQIASSIHETVLKTVKKIKHHSELIKYIYAQAPSLIAHEKTVKNDWQIKFINIPISLTSLKFLTEESMKQLGGKPVIPDNPLGIWRVENQYYYPYYESGFFWLYDHRYQSYDKTRVTKVTLNQHKNQNFTSHPRYWALRDLIEPEDLLSYYRGWSIGFRTQTNDFGERTGIFSMLPRNYFSRSLSLIISDRSPKEICCLYANLASIVIDYVIRQKFPGTHLDATIVERLPILPPEFYSEELKELIAELVIKLIYTSYDIRALALDLDIKTTPYTWDPDKRAVLQAKLDAIYAHLYKLELEELEHILDAFSALKDEECSQFDGNFRTKNLIIEQFKKNSKKIKNLLPN